jgi:hypothetical protein
MTADQLAAACRDYGQVCGPIDNGCGGTASCGGCVGVCCYDSCAPKFSLCP